MKLQLFLFLLTHDYHSQFHDFHPSYLLFGLLKSFEGVLVC
jgi:hypothetical protein